MSKNKPNVNAMANRPRAIWQIDQVLTDAVSFETAYIQHKYPNGGKQCDRANWVEYSDRKGTGFRYVYQTSRPWPCDAERPADLAWSKGTNASTYSNLVIICTTNQHVTEGVSDHVTPFVYNWRGGSPYEFEAFTNAFESRFNAKQREAADDFKNLLAAMRKKMGDKFPPLLVARVYDAETGTELDESPFSVDNKIFACAHTVEHIQESPSLVQAWNLSETHPVTMLASPILGKLIRVELVQS